jgi:hypothetical protein
VGSVGVSVGVVGVSVGVVGLFVGVVCTVWLVGGLDGALPFVAQATNPMDMMQHSITKTMTLRKISDIFCLFMIPPIK